MAAAANPALGTAQFEEIVDSIEKGLATARGVLRDIRTLDVPLLPDAVEEIWRDTIGVFRLGAEALIRAVERTMESALAPVRLVTMAHDWGGRIQEYATEVEAKTRWTELHALDEWEGHAADRYRKKTLSQSAAADRLGEMASAVSIHLSASAVSGFVFYGGIALVVTKLLWGLYTAVNQARTGAAALSGIGIALLAVKSAKKEYFGLLSTFGVFITEQMTDLVVLVNQANDYGQFPDDKWPAGVVGA